MTDRELLELAAKASGIDLHFRKALMPKDPDVPCYLDVNSVGESNHPYWQPVIRWNPLTDDGDALRLAVELKFEIFCGEDQSEVKDYEQTFVIIEEHKDHESPVSATRRAIVRAAAEIGKEMP